MSVTSQREMLEAAIAADFDDLAAHAAYADLLAEEGDPRGEYIQLQLALENRDQSPRLLAEWREQSHRLLQAHQRDWLGDLAPFLLDRKRSTVEPDRPNIDYSWNRGWLAELDVQDVRDAFTRVLADAPEARMLQALALRNTRLPNNQGPLEPLVGSGCLGTLKRFALGDPEAFGCTAVDREIPALIRKMPQVRELDLRASLIGERDLFELSLPHAQSLAVDFLSTIPLVFLTANSSLINLRRLFLWSRRDLIEAELSEETMRVAWTVQSIAEQLKAFCAAPQFARLTDLTLRFEDLGDEGCAAIARSGILRQLKRLDLRYCGITDAGVEALARSPDLARLEWLDVGANRIGGAGVVRLRELEIRVQYDSQWGDYPGPDVYGDEVV